MSDLSKLIDMYHKCQINTDALVLVLANWRYAPNYGPWYDEDYNRLPSIEGSYDEVEDAVEDGRISREIIKRVNWKMMGFDDED